jgi:cancer susceptibility candidate protein 1
MSEDKPAEETLITDVQQAQPMDAAGGAGDQSAKSKEKPKSKKKPSKKELARRRKEKAEQDRLEQIRIEKEREEERIRQQEQEMERREQERLQEEDGEMKILRSTRATRTTQTRAEKAREDEWRRYVTCDHGTNPFDQSDVNTFISLWEDVDDTDMPGLFAQIEKAARLLDQLADLRSHCEVSLSVDNYEQYSRQILDIRKLIQSKIEKLTSHHLLFSEKYASAKNEVLLSNEGGGYGYGLWVNLAKNPRVSSIDFNICSMEIYKTVAQAAIAIRCTTSPLLSEFGKYVFLSPILSCEFYQLPPPPKRIVAMTLRQVSTQQTLQTVQYPLKTAKPNEVQPPIVFKMKIDLGNLPEENDLLTVIKLDDIENTETQIANIEIDRENSILKFSSKTTGVFALAVGKYAHFPFQFWEINSTKEDSCELFIRTASIELTLEVDAGGLCSMEHPVTFSKLTAPAALEALQRHGINLIGPEHIDQLGESGAKLNEKTAELEDVLASGLADAATGFRIRCSKWNSQFPEDRAMLLAREIVEFGEPTSDDEGQTEEEEVAEGGKPEEEEKGEKPEKVEKPEKPEKPDPPPKKGKEAPPGTKWHAVLAKAKHINEVPYTENLEEAGIKMKKNTAFHQHLMPMLMDFASSGVQGRTRNASSFVVETLRFILQKVKLFSVTV